MSELLGVQLADIEEPIRASLGRYADIADGSIKFDLDGACALELTPDKPNSARSATPVKYLGEVVSTLYVIAFAPQDGTGDESTYKLAKTDTREYPHVTKVIPRLKTSMASEAHLTLLSKKLEAAADPVLFAGNLDLVGGGFGTLRKEGELGQTTEAYHQAIDSGRNPDPVSTLTVGYRGKLYQVDDVTMWNYWRQRFGDPHAVFNTHGELQVCGFIGIPSKDAKFEDLAPLRALNTVQPTRLQN